jgi:hypothetical protein
MLPGDSPDSKKGRGRDAVMDLDPPDMTRLPLKRRLAIIEAFVACHPGKPVTAILLDLFPELLRLDQ